VAEKEPHILIPRKLKRETFVGVIGLRFVDGFLIRKFEIVR